MKETKCKQTHQYFQQAKNECQTQIAALQADHRDDEAVFIKIRLNMFEIFHSIFSVGENVAGESEEKLVAFFRQRWDKIHLDWKAALEKAEHYGNAEKTHIEHIKLDTVVQIGEVFRCIWELEK